MLDVALNFVKDQTDESYERSVFSLLALTGNIGGLFEVFERSGNLIVGFFVGKIFLFSVLSNLYQVDVYNRGNLTE
jgi:hypothetical protein